MTYQNSPANAFVTEIGSGHVSLTGEETSFFISEKKNNRKHFFLFRKTTHGLLRCKRNDSNIGSQFSRRTREKLLKITLGLFLLKSPCRSKIFERKT